MTHCYCDMPFSNGDEALIKNTYPFKQEI